VYTNDAIYWVPFKRDPMRHKQTTNKLQNIDGLGHIQLAARERDLWNSLNQ